MRAKATLIIPKYTLAAAILLHSTSVYALELPKGMASVLKEGVNAKEELRLEHRYILDELNRINGRLDQIIDLQQKQGLEEFYEKCTVIPHENGTRFDCPFYL